MRGSLQTGLAATKSRCHKRVQAGRKDYPINLRVFGNAVLSPARDCLQAPPGELLASQPRNGLGLHPV